MRSPAACLLLVLLAPSAVASPGEVDTTFGSDGWLVREGAATQVLQQPGGRVVIGGWPGHEFGGGRFVLTGLRPDGQIDAAFGEDGRVETAFHFNARAIVQRDGRILVAGAPLERTSSGFAIERYTADGHLDTSFAGGTIEPPDAGAPPARFLGALAAAPGGGIVVSMATYGATYEPGKDVRLIRLRDDGSFDTGFGGDGVVDIRPGGVAAVLGGLIVQRNGGVLGVGYVRDRLYSRSRGTPDDWPLLVRLRADGSLDRRFGRRGVAIHRNPDDAGPLLDVARDPRTGRAVAFHATAVRAIVLRGFLSDGRNDRSFGRRGMGSVDMPAPYDDGRWFEFGELLRQADGKYLVVGANEDCIDRGPCEAHPVLARFTPQGAPDREFGQRGVLVADVPTEQRGEYDVFGSAMHGGFRSATVLEDERLLGAGFGGNGGLLGRFRDVVAPRFASLPGSLDASDGEVESDVTCHDGGPSCTARLVLAIRRAGRRVVVANQLSALEPGVPTALTASLSRTALRLLQRDGKLRVRSTLRLRDANGNSGTKRRKITLRRRA